tara:strand:+ start:3894 stop:4061 length:168 start_codon:yes stop_codon:yes gene_type:complete
MWGEFSSGLTKGSRFEGFSKVLARQSMVFEQVIWKWFEILHSQADFLVFISRLAG